VNDTDSGLYTDLTNVGLSVGGANRVLVDTVRLQADCVIRGQDGSVSAPMYSFTNDINTGIYRPVADRVAVTCGGVECFNTDQTANYFRGQINIPNGTSTVPALIFNSNQNYGIYCVPASDEIDFRIAGTTYHSFGSVVSNMPTQLKTRSIVNNTNLLSTGSNQTIVRLDTLVHSNFIYEITAAIDVVLPTSMVSGDVGLCLRIGKNSGNHTMTIKTNGTDFLNNATNGTVALSGGSYHYVEVILVKIVAGVSYWLSHLT
jgi:hypothetical protein